MTKTETAQAGTTEDLDRFPKSSRNFPIDFEEERREAKAICTESETNS